MNFCCRHTFASETRSIYCCSQRVIEFSCCLIWFGTTKNQLKLNLPALVTADAESDPLSKTSSFFVVVDAKLVCDVRLSDRLKVSRKFRSDDSDVDFFGELFVGLTTSSSLSARTYKLPIFSLIFCIFTAADNSTHQLIKSTLKWHQCSSIRWNGGGVRTLR